jgi:pimeloyl-ACP methyl ester carboxylesterase
MAFVARDGVKIYWDEEGEGPPILLIMGLSYPSAMWHRVRPALARHYRTIAFDNRGAGRSDSPPGPYSMKQMAEDAAAILDAAGVNRAHVYGVSMGGMIGQEFAQQCPQRVLSLILGCTSPGGRNSVLAEQAARDLLMGRHTLPPEEAMQASVPYIYDPGTPRERIDEDLALRRQWFPRPESYVAQLQAILGWESYDWLDQIQAPTLLIHGQSDRLVPARNSEIMAERIPGAKLVLLPHAGHIFSTDQPEAARDAVLDFLTATETAGIAR